MSNLKNPYLKVLWPTLLVLFLDQAAKLWVRSSLRLNSSRPVWGEDFFRLTHVENTGVAFGVQAGSTTFLIIFSAIASVILLYLLLRTHRANSGRHFRLMQLALALILGGALGNLIDRLLFGRVTDFLDFDFPNFIMQRWPVFNLADSAVTIGVILWCVHAVFFSKPETKTADQPKGEASILM